MKLFIGCSASDYISRKYFDDCRIFLEELFDKEYDLVFGACDMGLMGLSYNIARDKNRNILGVYPEIYKSSGESLECFTVPTKTIGERTDMVIEESDALIFLPGGFGTIYELFTALEFKKGLEFDKPIIIYNSCGYFDKFFEFIEEVYKGKFTSRETADCYYVCDNAEDALKYIDNYYGKGGISKKKKQKF